MRQLTVARLVLAVVSTGLEEVAIWAIWRWVLPELGINLPVVALVVVMSGWAVFGVTNFILISRVLRKQAVVGLPAMLGARGQVASVLVPEGLVRIKGELWTATAQEGHLTVGEEITVVEQEGLRLVVRRSPEG
ncbi:MAG: NfeD family protein [Chloroflexota bacterium]